MSEFESGIVGAIYARQNFRDMLDYIVKGNHLVISRSGKPVVAVIPFEDFKALIRDLEDFHDGRIAERNIAEGVAEGDPVALRIRELDAELAAEKAAAAKIMEPIAQ